MTASAEWRRKTLEKHRVHLDLAEPNDSEDSLEWDRVERARRLEAMRSFDPTASLPEELLVRLEGEEATTTGLKLEWEGLLRPLQQALEHDDVELELAGFSRGSTVLHFRSATRSPIEQISQNVNVDETPLAKPARDLLQAIAAAEGEQDMGRWLALIDSLQGLSAELGRLDLSVDLRWCPRSGRVDRAVLTETGRAYLHNLGETVEEVEPIWVNGRITELRESGVVKVKTGTSRNSTAYEVQIDPDTLSSMRLTLGQTVHWAAEALKSKDRLGRVRSTKYRFRRDMGRTTQTELHV